MTSVTDQAHAGLERLSVGQDEEEETRMRLLRICSVLGTMLVAWSLSSSAGAKPQAQADGKAIYAAHCARCHQPDGQGLAGRVPPLAGSSYLTGPDAKRVGIVLNGLRTSRHPVRAWPYDRQMKSFRPVLTDAQIAAVITYVSRSWGNTGQVISEEKVRAYRHVQETGPAAEKWQEPAKSRRSQGLH
jgi:mono/diheme cytochrome c family protein